MMRTGAADPLTSFEPICYLVVRRGSSSSTVPSPYRTLADLIDAVGAFTVSPLLCFGCARATKRIAPCPTLPLGIVARITRAFGRFPSTFGEWEKTAKKQIDAAAVQGVVIKPVIIHPDEFVAYCNEKKLSRGSKGRSRFAITLAEAKGND